jgi:hypothetical protein
MQHRSQKRARDLPSLWNIHGVATVTESLHDPQDVVSRLLTSKEGWIFLVQACILIISCYSLITQKPVTFHMDKPFEYTVPVSQAVGLILAWNAIIGLLVVKAILPGLSSPLIECPKCKKPGAYVKSAVYHCKDCGDSTPVGTQTQVANKKKMI